jgi:hypothetical protein
LIHVFRVLRRGTYVADRHSVLPLIFQQARMASSRVYVAALVSGVAAIVSGCAAETESATTHDAVGRVIQPIIGGTISGAEHDEVVVLVTFRDGARRFLCSATLVAPNLLLTARHCVTDFAAGSAACTAEGTPRTGAGVQADRDPSSLVLFVGSNGVAPDSSVEANSVARGSKLIVDTSTTTQCNHDIAFVVLDKPVTTAPVATIRLEALSAAEKVAAVGWGVDETGRLTASREIRQDLPLLGVGPGTYPDNPTLGFGRKEFMVGESTCAGDSGGPALSKTGAVVGVASRTGNGQPGDATNYAATCTGASAHAVYTQLSAHKDLVMRAFEAAGAVPKTEVAPQATPVTPPAAEATTETKPEGASALPPPPQAAKPEAGGCSMSSEPQNGAVEYAAGLVALLATLIGLRRRFGRRDEASPLHRERMPSLP